MNKIKYIIQECYKYMLHLIIHWSFDRLWDDMQELNVLRLVAKYSNQL